MIELVILEYLSDTLEVPVSLEKAGQTSKRYVIFEKTGSGKSNKLPSSVFAFQSYAESLYQAALLNDLVKEAVENMVVLPKIGRVQLNSDYNFTDTTTKQYRYQAVFDISHY